MLILFGTIYLYYYLSIFQNDLNAKADNVSSEVAKVLSIPVWNTDPISIKDISGAYLGSEFIQGIRIKTGFGFILDKFPTKTEGMIYRQRELQYSGEKLGTVELLFSKSSMDMALKIMVRGLAIVGFFIIISVLILVHLIMRKLLTLPLKNLGEEMYKYSTGNYIPSELPATNNEIGDITQAFNKMTAELQEKQTQLETAVKKYRGIFENALEGIFQTTKEGHLISANPAMTKILGYDSPDELINTVTDIQNQLYVDPTQRHIFLDLLMQHNVVKQFECQFVCKDKRIIWVSIQARAIKNEYGELNYIEGLLEDISDRKKAEEVIKNAYIELEKRIEERTAELRKTNEELLVAKDEALAAAESKSDFLANMSHEIRTPMNGVIAAADLALGEKLSPKVERYLNIIQSSGYSLLGIINDILDFSKIEAGKLYLENISFRIDEILEKTANLFIKRIQEKKIRLHIDLAPNDPMTFIGDPLRLQQIFINLVGNAIKFTESGGMIIFGLRNFEHLSDRMTLTFYVKDTGIGMKQEAMNNLFQPFTQADSSTTRKHGGTGLGLAISKQLVELMGGQIWAESEYEKGSTFLFMVKLPPTPENQEPKFQVPDYIRKLNILIVDKDPISRAILQKILKSFGMETEEMESDIRVFSRLKEKQFDLIIMDWYMSEIDNLEASTRIRKELNLKTPIIMFTAFGKETEKLEAERIEINGSLTKPLMPSHVFDMIMEIFGKIALKETRQSNEIITQASLFKKRIKGCRILVAEDNLTNQEIARAVLEGAGVIIEIANNGKEAVELVKISDFDAVLMDMQMPEMDGYEATRIIRKDLKFKSLPIIAMTAHAMKGDEEKCLSAGMDGYVTKPINQEILFKTLSKMIKVKELSEDEKRFLELNKDIMNQIWDAYNNQTLSLLESLSRSLKDSAYTINEKKITNISKRIEIFCIEKKPISKSLIENLSIELNKVFESLRSLY
ncbi:MAG: response regulator [Desulfobacterales bacterium]|nr:response regulator [Desulfobacterales bacterium]